MTSSNMKKCNVETKFFMFDVKSFMPNVMGFVFMADL